MSRPECVHDVETGAHKGRPYNPGASPAYRHCGGTPEQFV